jgi:hypothetical protein
MELPQRLHAAEGLVLETDSTTLSGDETNGTTFRRGF